METIVDIPYALQALFAAVRISLWFVLLFGFIAPLFLKHTRSLPGIEKLIYSWVGLGGVIIFTVFVLSVLHIYDFISLVLTLLLIPLIISIKESKQGPFTYLRNFEYKTLISHVRFIERFEGFKWPSLKKKWKTPEPYSTFGISRVIMVISIAICGGLIRMFPALQYASPFSRSWFYKLDRIKNIRLQDYFSGYPEPAGLHSLVSVFSMLTQLSPEMILHLLGALTSFFLCIIIFVSIKDITRNEYPMAAIFGMAVYAITPMLFMPLSLDLQIEANSIDLALCFAIPTIMIFMRNLRATYKSPWFYVLSGFIATGMTNFFVAFVVLLPLMVIGLFGLPRRRYIRSFLRVFSYLLIICGVVIAPFVVYALTHNISFGRFFIEQLYSTRVYSYFPRLILPIEELSVWYLWIGGITLAGYLLEKLIRRQKGIRDEIIFLLIFLSLSVIYSPLFDTVSSWLDTDQLNAFYSIMVALSAGILFSSVMRWCQLLFRFKNTLLRSVGMALFAFAFAFIVYRQGGVILSRQLPATVPNGFHQSYYNIINEFLPYSYATVAPQIERIAAKNRHYFMDYEYFLTKYGASDSLYHQQLASPAAAQSANSVLPASIFIFMEKAPYDSIQQGILYDSPRVMRDLKQWLTHFRNLEGRSLQVYYEDQQSIVYRIVNRRNESRISDILMQVRPGNKGNPDE